MLGHAPGHASVHWPQSGNERTAGCVDILLDTDGDYSFHPDRTGKARLMIPSWLHALAIISLLVGAVSALILFVDVRRHPQHMRIMNVVWPITGLYAGALGL